MTVNVDPSVSLLISNIRNANLKSRNKIQILEFKKILARDLYEDPTEYSMWKKLFFIFQGFKINSLDFIKACASKNLKIKRIGYQGVSMLNCEREILLMGNTILKDLKNKSTISDALIFLASIQNTNCIRNILDGIEPPLESHIFNKFLIVKNKFENNIVSIESENDLNLFVKLQILIDSSKINFISSKDIQYFTARFSSIKCVFTKIKAIQFFSSLFKNVNYVLPNELLVEFKNILNKNTRFKNQLELALALEVINILIVSNNITEKVEEFIFKLISNNNVNLKYIGYKIVSKYKINSEIAINQILESESFNPIYFDTLHSLINKSNYKIVFEKILEYKKCNSKNLELNTKLIMKIIIKIAKFAKNDFLGVILFEFPEVYGFIDINLKESKNILSEIYDKIYNLCDKKYFILLYSLTKLLKKNINIEKLIFDHLNILFKCRKNKNLSILNYLIDFLCTYGDINANREHYKSFLLKVAKDIDQILLNASIQGLMMFNLVLPVKMIHVDNFHFVSYYKTDKSIVFNHDNNYINLNFIGKNCTDANIIKNKNVTELLIGNNETFALKITYKNNEIYKFFSLNKF